MILKSFRSLILVILYYGNLLNHDAVKRLLEFGDNIGPICDAVQKPKLKQVEVDFLKEYTTVMEPLALLLDQLQGDQHCYNGMLLPKLTQLRHKLFHFTNCRCLLLIT